MASLGRPNVNESLSADARQELDLRIGCAFHPISDKIFPGLSDDETDVGDNRTPRPPTQKAAKEKAAKVTFSDSISPSSRPEELPLARRSWRRTSQTPRKKKQPLKKKAPGPNSRTPGRRSTREETVNEEVAFLLLLPIGIRSVLHGTRRAGAVHETGPLYEAPLAMRVRSYQHFCHRTKRSVLMSWRKCFGISKEFIDKELFMFICVALTRGERRGGNGAGRQQILPVQKTAS
ncbi:hypothetical protein niasHT_014642 [Heterodera trifolii]|uniref:Uncharacterized protein n=1 Tax=Heterodera trifolii TaxID=157864 RepID=A0ABD2LHY7_9BILA